MGNLLDTVGWVQAVQVINSISGVILGEVEWVISDWLGRVVIFSISGTLFI